MDISLTEELVRQALINMLEERLHCLNFDQIYQMAIAAKLPVCPQGDLNCFCWCNGLPCRGKAEAPAATAGGDGGDGGE
jgi:hypothetical protein